MNNSSNKVLYIDNNGRKVYPKSIPANHADMGGFYEDEILFSDYQFNCDNCLFDFSYCRFMGRSKEVIVNSRIGCYNHFWSCVFETSRKNTMASRNVGTGLTVYIWAHHFALECWTKYFWLFREKGKFLSLFYHLNWIFYQALWNSTVELFRYLMNCDVDFLGYHLLGFY